MSYSNTNRFIVIKDDDRNPDTSWQNHLERGSAGGVDCVAPMRTKLYAPTDCIVSSYWGGTGGRTIRMAEVDGNRRPTGWLDEFMHTDEAPVTGFVPAGGFVGYSGDSGGDYAPHVHWHRIDSQGRRRNPWHYFTSSPSGGDYTEIGDDDMPLNADTDYPAFLAMLQRALAFDARPKGAGATWTLGPTIWERFNSIESAVKQLARPDLDEKALAQALAPLLDFSTLSDADLNRIANRVADVQAARLKA